MSDDDLPEEPDDVPTVACSRCGRKWDLTYELEDLRAGNRAVEQFALDHERHTGHYPDDVTPWLVTCQHCPDGEQFLAERPARRWARTHARHTRHDVLVREPHGTRPSSRRRRRRTKGREAIDEETSRPVFTL